MTLIAEISYQEKEFNAVADLPLSKSESNRVLVIRHLAGFPSEQGPLYSDSEDTVLLHEILKSIIPLRGGDRPKVVDCGNAGTAFRFLAALLSVTPGNWVLTGSRRMLSRPAGALADTLNNLGASIEYAGVRGFPPLLIRGRKYSGGKSVIDAGISSQFISALMLTGPSLEYGLQLSWEKEPVSFPYIGMTAELMRKAGIEVGLDRCSVDIPSSGYREFSVQIGKDWSSAAFWYEMLALRGEGTVYFPGLQMDSIQGDRYCAHFFRSLGIVTAQEEKGVRITRIAGEGLPEVLNMKDYPDLILPLAVALAGNNIPCTIEGAGHLRYKESDRLEGFSGMMRKAGYNIEAGGDRMVIGKSKALSGSVTFNAHDDHRIVMALAPLALKHRKVTITGYDAVKKSYPGFFKHIRQAGFSVQYIKG